jgi:hypothetical protein
MKNSLLSLMLASLGVVTVVAGASDITPTEVKAIVSKVTNPLESVRLTVYGHADLPVIEGANTSVESIKPGKSGIPLMLSGVLALGAGCLVYRRGTGRLVKEFPIYLENLKHTASANYEYQQLERQAALAIIPETRELSPAQLEELAHYQELQKYQREQELLEEQIRVVEARKKLEAALNSKIVEQTPKETLLELLKGHENGWLDLILKGNKPLIFLAPAGAGKTTTANAMLMAKKIAYGCEPMLVADVHGHKNMAKNWKYLKKVAPNVKFVGFSESEGNDWDSYLESFYEMPAYFDSVIPDEKDDPNMAKTSSFWDEKTLAKSTAIERGEGDKHKRAFVEAFTGSRKGQHAFMLGLHNFTITSVPDGCYDQLRQAANRLQLFTKPDNTPSFTGLLFSLDETGQEVQTQVTIPDWLNPKYMAKLWNQADAD